MKRTIFTIRPMTVSPVPGSKPIVVSASKHFSRSEVLVVSGSVYVNPERPEGRFVQLNVGAAMELIFDRDNHLEQDAIASLVLEKTIEKYLESGVEAQVNQEMSRLIELEGSTASVNFELSLDVDLNGAVGALAKNSLSASPNIQPTTLTGTQETLTLGISKVITDVVGIYSELRMDGAVLLNDSVKVYNTLNRVLAKTYQERVVTHEIHSFLTEKSDDASIGETLYKYIDGHRADRVGSSEILAKTLSKSLISSAGGMSLLSKDIHLTLTSNVNTTEVLDYSLTIEKYLTGLDAVGVLSTLALDATKGSDIQSGVSETISMDVSKGLVDDVSASASIIMIKGFFRDLLEHATLNEELEKSVDKARADNVFNAHSLVYRTQDYFSEDYFAEDYFGVTRTLV